MEKTTKKKGTPIKVERNPDGTIKKGSVLNPKGRKKGKFMSTLIREALLVEDDDGVTLGERVAKALVDNAKKGDIYAIREVNDRIDGKAVQTIKDESEEVDESTKKKIDQLFKAVTKNTK